MMDSAIEETEILSKATHTVILEERNKPAQKLPLIVDQFIGNSGGSNDLRGPVQQTSSNTAST